MVSVIKVSDAVYRKIMEKKGDLTMKTGKNYSVIGTVDVIFGIESKKKKKER